MTTITALSTLSRFTGPALVDRINDGVSAHVFAGLAAALDIPGKKLAESLGLSTRTLRNRSRLSADETERAYRVYRVYKRACEVLETEDGARAWMNSKQSALGERTPLSMLVRDVGTEEVMNLLGAIEHGGYM